MVFKSKKTASILLSLAIFLMSAMTAFAGTFSDNLRVQKHIGDTVQDISFSDIAESSFWVEPVPVKSDHTCMNRGISFRLMELLAKEWPDGVLRPYDVTLELGWPFGCSSKLFNAYIPIKWDESLNEGSGGYAPILDEDGKYVIREGIIKTSDFYFTKELPEIIEKASDLYWVEAKINSTGRKVRLSLSEGAFPEDYFSVIDRWQKEVWPKLQSGEELTEEEKKLDDRRHELQEEALKVVTAPEEDSYKTGKNGETSSVDLFVTSNELKYISSGGTKTIDISTAEEEEEGVKKFCLCQAVAFRISQMMSSCWSDGLFHPEDVSIETGWNTDGPYEFWQDDLGIDEKDIIIPEGSTSGKDLSDKDSWFILTIKSTGKTYTFNTSALYCKNFLELRSKSKNGTITAEEKKELQKLRKEIVSDVKELPFSGGISLVDEGHKLSIINDVLTSDELNYSENGKKNSLKIMDSVTEASGESMKVCLCQAVAFRISQMMSSCWSDGLFHPEDVTIETGWNTDGPYEFWEDDLKINKSDIKIASDATENEELSLKDTWYKITLKSTGETFCFHGTENLYISNFLDLRSKAKKGQISLSDKKRQKYLRSIIVKNITEKPVIGLIKATEPKDTIDEEIPIAYMNDSALTPDCSISSEMKQKIKSLEEEGKKVVRTLRYHIDSTSKEIELTFKVDLSFDHSFFAKGEEKKIQEIGSEKLLSNQSKEGKTTLKLILKEGSSWDEDPEKTGIQSDIYLTTSEKRQSDSNGSSGCNSGIFSISSLLMLTPLMLIKRQ